MNQIFNSLSAYFILNFCLSLTFRYVQRLCISLYVFEKSEVRNKVIRQHIQNSDIIMLNDFS